MSETPAETTAEGDAAVERVAIRYQPLEGTDPGPISLPGYLNAQPAIVRGGDVFVVDAGEVENLTVSDRFEVYDGDVVSPNEELTDEQLVAKIGVPADVAEPASREQLLEAADLLDKVRPLPPVDPSDAVVAGTVAPAEEGDTTVPDLVDAGMAATELDAPDATELDAPDAAEEQTQPAGDPPQPAPVDPQPVPVPAAPAQPVDPQPSPSPDVDVDETPKGDDQ